VEPRPVVSAAALCPRCGTALARPPDLEALAQQVDAQVAAERRRPVERTEWAGGAPDGLLDNLFPWLSGAKERRAIWSRGQQLWVEAFTRAQSESCPHCLTAATRPAAALAHQPAPTKGDEYESRTIVATAAPRERAGPHVVVLEGPVHGHQFALTTAATEIGRSIACQITVDDDRVAYQNTRIVQQDGRWLARDTAGSSGTYVNGERLAGDRELRHGDTLTIGNARLRFAAGETG
jgi:hypothetical protein